MMPGIHIIERDGLALVFGLEWLPLLGRHPERQARVLGRRQRARHLVLSSGVAASVGLLHCSLRRRRDLRYYSAAAVFASLHRGGTLAAVLPLPDGRHWLVAVHEGAVMTRSDQLHADPDYAGDTLKLLSAAHPALVMHEESASSLLDILFEAARDEGELTRIRGRFGVPAPFLSGVSLAAVILLGFLLWRALMPAPVGVSSAPVESAEAAWRNAIAASIQPHAVQGVAGLQSVLDAIHDVPASLAGWQLVEIECTPQGSQWHCLAAYRRSDDSDNQGFILAARPDWVLSFDPLDGARVAWSVPMPALPLGAVTLRSAYQNERRLVSALQAIRPAFSELRLDAPRPLLPQPPRDARQQPFSRPDGIVSFQRRPLRLQAPLRSISVLLPETVHMSWDRILLQVAPIDQPSLRSSSLRISLSGVLYEIEDIHAITVDVSASVGSGRHDDKRRDSNRANHGA
ncbi:MAG: type 4b pilus protein PilO2 [Burkholderiaceae bacterium]